jgi:formylglycine-generating enzyme required for sulfatase activity
LRGWPADDSLWSKEFEYGDTIYQLAKYQVTNRAYGAYLAQSGAEPPEYWRDPACNQPNFPVVGITVIEVLDYCEWLTASERAADYCYFLPTPEQWDFVAHSGEPRVLQILLPTDDNPHQIMGDPIGSDELSSYIESLREQQGVSQPAAIGIQRHPSLEICDLHGDLWEWCDPDPSESDHGTRPSREANGKSVQVKGGGFLGSNDPFVMLVGGAIDPLTRWRRLGFRLARTRKHQHTLRHGIA